MKIVEKEKPKETKKTKEKKEKPAGKTAAKETAPPTGKA